MLSYFGVCRAIATQTCYAEFKNQLGSQVEDADDQVSKYAYAKHQSVSDHYITVEWRLFERG